MCPSLELTIQYLLKPLGSIVCEEKRMGKENLSVNGRVEDKKHDNFVGGEKSS